MMLTIVAVAVAAGFQGVDLVNKITQQKTVG